MKILISLSSGMLAVIMATFIATGGIFAAAGLSRGADAGVADAVMWASFAVALAAPGLNIAGQWRLYAGRTDGRALTNLFLWASPVLAVLYVLGVASIHP